MTEAWPTGTLIADKFRVVRVLGSGGMGVVYEVIHELTRHRRALKTLNEKAREQPSAIERFLREASAAGRIGNPHIAETFDAGVLDGGEPYIVMELLEGETLEARVLRNGRLDPESIVSIFCQACEGIQAAHDAGIIHRDLKPENIFLTTTRAGLHVKILDFGVSIFDERHRLDRSTQEGTILGTPYYMSPEQVRGQELDGRSDVYALGIMMHECALGTHPYPAETIPAIVANVLERRPPPLTDIIEGFPAVLSDVCALAIEKDRDRRLPSARAFADALARAGRELGLAAPASMSGASGAPLSKAGAGSWISAPSPSLVQNGALSAAEGLSVPPPGVESRAVPVGSDGAAALESPRRAPLALSAVGGLLGAAVVAVALYFALVRGGGTDASREPGQRTGSTSSTPAGEASREPPTPNTTSREPEVKAAPPEAASVSPSAGASSSASTTVNAPPATSASGKPSRPGGKPGLAGKDEFRP